MPRRERPWVPAGDEPSAILVPTLPHPTRAQDLTFPLIEQPDSFVVQGYTFAVRRQGRLERAPASRPRGAGRWSPRAAGRPPRLCAGLPGRPALLHVLQPTRCPPATHPPCHSSTLPAATLQDYLSELPDPMSTIYGNSSIDKAMTVAYNNTRVSGGAVRVGERGGASDSMGRAHCLPASAAASPAPSTHPPPPPPTTHRARTG